MGVRKDMGQVDGWWVERRRAGYGAGSRGGQQGGQRRGGEWHCQGGFRVCHAQGEVVATLTAGFAGV